MLKWELWFALYLVCGVATYVWGRVIIKKTLQSYSIETQILVSFYVILIWPIILLTDLAGYIRYRYRWVRWKLFSRKEAK